MIQILKSVRIGIIQAMVMQALAKHYISLFLSNFNSHLQTVIIVNIAFGRFSTSVLQFLGDQKVLPSEQVIITIPSVKTLLIWEERAGDFHCALQVFPLLHLPHLSWRSLALV